MAEREEPKFALGNLNPCNLEKLVFLLYYLKYLRVNA